MSEQLKPPRARPRTRPRMICAVAVPAADRDKLGDADGLDMSFQTSLERVEIRVEIPRSVRKR
jgi:hypothetical protein